MPPWTHSDDEWADGGIDGQNQKIIVREHVTDDEK